MKKLILVGNCLDFSGVEPCTPKYLKENKAEILKTAKRQLDSGVQYLNIRVGSQPQDGPALRWLVTEIQKSLDNCPLFLDSESRSVVEQGLSVYNRDEGKPFINSADFGKRENYLNLAADYNAKVVCVCMRDETPLNEKERLDYCAYMLEKGMELNIPADDMFFDPVTVSIVEEQESLVEVLHTIEQITDLRLNTICNLQKVSGWVRPEIRPFIESAFLNMAMVEGLKAAIIDPKMKLLMANIVAGENILNKRLFSQGEWTNIIDVLKSREEDK